MTLENAAKSSLEPLATHGNRQGNCLAGITTLQKIIKGPSIIITVGLSVVGRGLEKYNEYNVLSVR